MLNSLPAVDGAEGFIDRPHAGRVAGGSSMTFDEGQRTFFHWFYQLTDGGTFLEADALVGLGDAEVAGLVQEDRSVVGHVPSHVRHDHQRVGQHMDKLKRRMKNNYDLKLIIKIVDNLRQLKACTLCFESDTRSYGISKL